MGKLIKEKIEIFFKKLQIDIKNLNISVEDESIFNIKIKTDDSWIVIWPHGKNIDSIQNILRLIASITLGKKASLHLEVNDYIKTKDDRLFDFIKSKISYVEKINKDIALPFLNSYERKKVHSFISDLNKKHITTQSRWEWKERRLFICIDSNKINTTSKLTIDIDWDDI